MTEDEWLACDDPQRMLPPFPTRASVRTGRLFAAACCRRFGMLLEQSPRTRRDELLAMMERRADVKPPEDWVDAVTGDAECAAPYEEVEGCSKIAEFYFMVQHAGLMPLVGHLANTARTMGFPDETAKQADLIRCIFGNPFRPATFDPAWRTSTVKALASQMYESREFDRMPILADALQDAGCDSDEVLNHCRDPHANHVHGCWVVDLVLGKS